MRTIDLNISPVLRTIALVAGVLGLIAWSASAQTPPVNLIAAPLTKGVTLPNGTSVSVPMWGFALDENGNGVLDGAEAPTVPGPRITLPPGTTSLTVHLTNGLVDSLGQPVPGAENVSIVVIGQPFDATPVTRTDANGHTRIFSMTPDVAPGASRDYIFSNLKPGSFLYESGSHQAVQVQMGLYGALTIDAAAGEAYAGIAYGKDILVLHSEIDIALHESVAAGRFGRADLGGPTSTIDYKPTLYLINGESFADEISPTIDAGTSGQVTLIRFLNAGLKTHVPLLENDSLKIVAEDGNAYSFARTQADLMLSAGKTHDVLWTPPASGTYNLYDRSLSVNAEGQGDGGMIAKLTVAASASEAAPLLSAGDDAYTTAEDAALAVAVSGVLGNDSAGTTAALATSAKNGVAVLSADGSFTYTPNANFFGVDSFTYTVTDGTNVSKAATVRITVTAVADAPVANAAEVGLDAKTSAHITLTGSDPDGDALSFYLSSLPAHGTVSVIDPVTLIEQALTSDNLRSGASALAIPGGALIYTPDPGVAPAPPYSGQDSFQFLAADASADSAAAPVNATVHPLEAAATCATCVPLNLTVLGRDPLNPALPPVPIAEYRWTLEEDRTYDVQPGIADPNTVSVSFHSSYMPVVGSGDQAVQPMVDTAPDANGVLKRYFVSVLPKTGPYTNGGTKIGIGQTDATVTVNKGPQPTAQARVRAFEDNAPLNGVWDATEPGLAGFEVGLDDAGGRYGMSGGQQLMDNYGNPLGTEYQACSAPPCAGYEVASYGKGYLLTDADGYVLFKNLPPGKFTVKVRAPGGQKWMQTSTIEGTPGIDAWVKNNEPQYFAEFGPPGPHVEVGFARATTGAGILGVGAGPFSVITGRVTNLHMSRPPAQGFSSAGTFDFTRPIVALNAGAVGGTLLWAQPTNEDGTFRIEGVPSGSYQLVVFDSALDLIIASQVVNVAAPTEAALGDVQVFSWFTRLYHYVFEDANENGFRDAGEAGIPEQAINLRWRDGSMYMSSATDRSGFVPFEEVFPFFAWLVAEVDFTRFKATGVTVVVDAGGNTSVNTDWPAQVGAEVSADVLNPQLQSENNNLPWRTETGTPLILLEGFQGFIGQTSVMLWGKTAYAPPGSIVEDVNVAPFDDFPGPGDTDANGNGTFDRDQFHGGITGVVHYSITRAENDPRWGTAEPWEPGIPRVRVQLWDEKRTKLLNEVVTDSWDDAQPTGCQGEVFTFLGRATDCYDGLRNFNQVRPAVFDGGYAFLSIKEPFADAAGSIVPVDQRQVERPIPFGRYVVKVVVPDGYKLVKEEDKNVDFGEEYIPQQFWVSGYPLGDSGVADAQPKVTVEEYPLYAPFCVGAEHVVPATLSLFPDSVNGAYGGDKRPLCDAKLVDVKPGSNAAANFFFFTEAPIAAHVYGFVLDDTTNEFDPNAPTFGEKYAPPFMPVAMRDWTGREVVHTITDAYGVYNTLVASTYTAATPIPSGMSPSMITACINSPTMIGPDGSQVPDPNFHKEYSHFCYTMQFMPGTTSYLDTPVLPTGAFTGNGSYPVDAELPEQTPIVAQVTSLYQPAGLGIVSSRIGPYVVDRGLGGATTANGQLRTIEILSAGPMDVPNPAYTGVGSVAPKIISRDFGFGSIASNGIVRLGSQILQVLSWNSSAIRAVVPTGALSGELSVERCIGGSKLLTTPACPGDSRKSILAATVTVASALMHTARPPKVIPAGATGPQIQAVIDAATTKPGDLVLVPPGIYEDMLVMTKPVRLQGWGAINTIINVVSTPAEKLQAWRDYVGNLVAANPSYLLPDQQNIIGPPPFAEGVITAGIGGEGAAIQVFGKNQATVPILGLCLGTVPAPANEAYCLQNENYGRPLPSFRPNARIDGFALSGTSQAAAIMVNGNNRFLEISNNRILNNYGDFAGGIRIGHAGGPLPLADEDANNANVSIHNNMVLQNAGIGAGGGGGIVIGTGTHNYEVRSNFVAGNFTAGQGAGIAHIGLSRGGTIDRNTVIFNEGFNQGLTLSGGGIFVGGRPALAGALTPGSGNVTITNNLIQGNQAAGGDGGGIALVGVNGQDISQFSGPLGSLLRYRVNLFNNMIANNVAGLAGGGLSLQDAAYVNAVHNTIVHNDSLATAGAAFTAGPNQSVPQPSGIVSRGHTPLLAAALGAGEPAFANPRLVNNIIWQNRSFYFGVVSGGGIIVPGGNPTIQYGLIANPQTYWDLGVLGAAAGSQLAPEYSVLTNVTGYAASNINVAPAFVTQYVNGGRSTYTMPDVYAPIAAPAAFDEGGNFIRPQFGPLSIQAPDGSFFGNYHVRVNGTAGAALNTVFALVPPALLTDIDAQPRPSLTPNRGADEKTATLPPVTPIP